MASTLSADELPADKKLHPVVITVQNHDIFFLLFFFFVFYHIHLNVYFMNSMLYLKLKTKAAGTIFHISITIFYLSIIFNLIIVLFLPVLTLRASIANTVFLQVV